MSDLLISPTEILDLMKEVGHSLHFLVRTIDQPWDPATGAPPIYGWNKRKLDGYVVPYSPKAIYLSPSGAMPLIQGDYIGYIAASSFSPELLSGDTFIEWSGRNYNVEAVDAIYHRSQILLYKLTLKRTQDQQVIEASLPAAEISDEEEPGAGIESVALAGWTDLRTAYPPEATYREGLSLVQSEEGIVPSGVHDWGAWIKFNSSRDITAEDIKLIAKVRGTVLIGLVGEGVAFDQAMPQRQMIAGLHLANQSIGSLLKTDGNFYNYANPTSLSEALHLFTFSLQEDDLMMSIAELSDTWQATPVLEASLGHYPVSRAVHLSLITPHESITLLALN